MAKLKPIKMPDETVEAVIESPIIYCDHCGAQLPRHRMINVIISCPSPGHEKLVGIGCPEEHWACSIPCWQACAHACIDEHLTPLLNYHHGKVGM